MISSIDKSIGNVAVCIVLVVVPVRNGRFIGSKADSPTVILYFFKQPHYTTVYCTNINNHYTQHSTAPATPSHEQRTPQTTTHQQPTAESTNPDNQQQSTTVKHRPPLLILIKPLQPPVLLLLGRIFRDGSNHHPPIAIINQRHFTPVNHLT